MYNQVKSNHNNMASPNIGANATVSTSFSSPSPSPSSSPSSSPSPSPDWADGTDGADGKPESKQGQLPRYMLAVSGNLQSCKYTECVHRCLTDFLSQESVSVTTVFRRLNGQTGIVERKLWSFDFGEVELVPHLVASEIAYSEQITPRVCDFFEANKTPNKSVKSLAKTMDRRGGKDAIHKWSCAEKKALLYFEVNSKLLSDVPTSESKQGFEHINPKICALEFYEFLNNFYSNVLKKFDGLLDSSTDSTVAQKSVGSLSNEVAGNFVGIKDEKDLIKTLIQKTIGGLVLQPSGAMNSFAGHFDKKKVVIAIEMLVPSVKRAFQLFMILIWVIQCY